IAITRPEIAFEISSRNEVPVGSTSVLQKPWKNSGKKPAMTVVAKAEFAQSYSAQERIWRFLSRSRTEAKATRCAWRRHATSGGRSVPFCQPFFLTGGISALLRLARRAEGDLRPALDGEVEVHARRRQVHQRAGVIQREVVVRLGAEFIEMLLVRAVHPARGVHVHGVEHAGDRVFVLQPECHHFELQLTDG